MRMCRALAWLPAWRPPACLHVRSSSCMPCRPRCAPAACVSMPAVLFGASTPGALPAPLLPGASTPAALHPCCLCQLHCPAHQCRLHRPAHRCPAHRRLRCPAHRCLAHRLLCCPAHPCRSAGSGCAADPGRAGGWRRHRAALAPAGPGANRPGEPLSLIQVKSAARRPHACPHLRRLGLYPALSARLHAPCRLRACALPASRGRPRSAACPHP